MARTQFSMTSIFMEWSTPNWELVSVACMRAGETNRIFNDQADAAPREDGKVAVILLLLVVVVGSVVVAALVVPAILPIALVIVRKHIDKVATVIWANYET